MPFPPSMLFTCLNKPHASGRVSRRDRLMLPVEFRPLSLRAVLPLAVVAAVVAASVVWAEPPAEDIPKTATEKPLEGELEPFLGPSRFEVQEVFNRGRFPNVVVATDGTVVATWGKETYRVRRSEDGGRTWEPEMVIAKYRRMYAETGWDKLREDRHRRLLELGLIPPDTRLSPRDPRVPAWEDAEHWSWEAERMAVYAAQIDCLDQNIGRLLTIIFNGGT